MKPETAFRINRVDPFLKSLDRTVDFSIQQLSICGTPDKFVCVNGLFLAMELKSEDGEMDALQEVNRAKIIQRGRGLAWEVRPQNWEEIKKRLIALNKGESPNGKGW